MLSTLALEFTGKERDSETGLDYFGARHYAGVQGRWTSPDKLVLIPDLSEPQGWNKYAYALNRPLVFVDPDGMWSGWYHTIILQDTFGHMGTRVVNALVRASEFIDRIPEGQASSLSYQHAMRDGERRQTVDEAGRLSRQFINEEINAAVDAQIKYENDRGVVSRSGESPLADEALRHLGYAIHTATDATSPEHRGYQPWSCLYCASALQHHNAEEASAKSSEFGDAEARHQAHVEAERTYNLFRKRLAEKQAEEALRQWQNR